jgi:hypothetical protein
VKRARGYAGWGPPAGSLGTPVAQFEQSFEAFRMSARDNPQVYDCGWVVISLRCCRCCLDCGWAVFGTASLHC